MLSVHLGKEYYPVLHHEYPLSMVIILWYVSLLLSEGGRSNNFPSKLLDRGTLYSLV